VWVFLPPRRRVCLQNGTNASRLVMGSFAEPNEFWFE
jgi:hypothetical protein